jgi:NAD(P)H-binding
MSKRELFAVYGATGHTGRFVVSELQRRGLTYRAVGRDERRLQALGMDPSHVASLEDVASLANAFDGASAVINCAGPFLDTAAPTIQAAFGAGAHYLDVTAEQQSARDSFSAFDKVARQNGLALLPATGFFGGLADLLVGAALDDWSSADSATVAVFLDSWHPTGGTRATGARNHFPRVVLRNHELVPVAGTTPPDSWTFSPPFGEQAVAPVPLSEIITISRHAAVASIDSLMNRPALAELADPATGTPRATDERGRSAQRFLMDVRVERGGQFRRATASGVDIYAISASLVVDAALRVVAHPDATKVGGLTLAELGRPSSFLTAVTMLYPGFRFSVEPESLPQSLPGSLIAVKQATPT